MSDNNVVLSLEIAAGHTEPTVAERKLLEIMRSYGPHCDFIVRKRPLKDLPQGTIIDVEVSFKEPISIANTRLFYPQKEV